MLKIVKTLKVFRRATLKKKYAFTFSTYGITILLSLILVPLLELVNNRAKVSYTKGKELLLYCGYWKY